MRVGVARFVIQIPGARTLKDRRHVVRSFKDRVQARHPVSIAEIGDTERLQVATFGVAVVSSDAEVCASVLNQITQLAEGLSEAVLAEVRTEIISLAEAGSGIDNRFRIDAPQPRRSRLLDVEPVIRPKKGNRT